MTGIKVEVDTKPAAQAFRGDVVRIGRGVAAAVNQAVGNATTRLRTDVRRRKTLPVDTLKQRIRVTQRAIELDPTAVIASDGRANTLGRFRRSYNPIRFGTPAAPVNVEVNVGASKTIASGFFVPLRRGKVAGGNGAGIAIRISIARKLGISVRKGSSSSLNQRSPFTVLYGPSEAQDLIAAWDQGQNARTATAVQAALDRKVAAALAGSA